jgi:hypothetical protein
MIKQVFWTHLFLIFFKDCCKTKTKLGKMLNHVNFQPKHLEKSCNKRPTETKTHILHKNSLLKYFQITKM